MPNRSPRLKIMYPVIAGLVASGFCLSASVETARAAPAFASPPVVQTSPVMQVRIYRRGRPPIYPYYYNPGRPGGYSFYFGFVPYAKGDYGTQAIQRSLYPQDIEWPPSMDAYGPRPGWGPKAPD